MDQAYSDMNVVVFFVVLRYLLPQCYNELVIDQT